jgi:hypothetical protein
LENPEIQNPGIVGRSFSPAIDVKPKLARLPWLDRNQHLDRASTLDLGGHDLFPGRIEDLQHERSCTESGSGLDDGR